MNFPLLLQKACLNKSNLTEEIANQIIDSEIEKGNILYYYKCQLCKSHHLTKSIPNKDTQDIIKELIYK